MKTQLLKGNNLDLLKTLEPNSVDAVVCDPPYGIAFMNKKWDYDVPSVELWKEVYRVLKPGGHILSFGGTRTYHRMVVNIEDAGFEIRDCIQWIYGSGFPKSLNIGKAIDEYKGWGTALKPANEPIVLARKPLDKKTIAENVKEWRTGGINIDGCRIATDDNLNGGMYSSGEHKWNNDEHKWRHKRMEGQYIQPEGRFPSNVILDEKAAEVMDEQSGESKSVNRKFNSSGHFYFKLEDKYEGGYNDTGGASRFFYIAKVSKKERNMGLDGLEEKETPITNQSKKCSNCNKWELAASGDEYVCKCIEPNWYNNKQKNNHPTIKPINLLTYLIRLITPPNGVVLDMYMGSGSTGIAALLEGKSFIGMEMDEEYFKIAEARINNYEMYKKLLK